MLEPPSPSSIALTFQGDELDPDEVSKALGRSPTMHARQGDVVTSSLGMGSGLAKTGYWSLRTEWGSDQAPDDKIRKLLMSLTGDTRTWLTLARSCPGSLVCHIEPAGGRQALRLSSEVLADIAARGLSFTLIMERKAAE